MSAYTERAYQQAVDWLKGVVKHNSVDDECTPDFACCIPDLFEQDRAVRREVVNDYARRHGYREIFDD